jgi:putative PIN family toxin of toxin-antitoxin system
MRQYKKSEQRKEEKVNTFKMKVVVDCNVLISAGLTPNGTCYKLINKLTHKHEIFVVDEIVNEYLKTITKPNLIYYKDRLSFILQLLLDSATKVSMPPPCSFSLPDPKDEIYLATALAVEAEVIITGNKKHFPLIKYSDVLIMSPREFLDYWV